MRFDPADSPRCEPVTCCDCDRPEGTLEIFADCERCRRAVCDACACDGYDIRQCEMCEAKTDREVDAEAARVANY